MGFHKRWINEEVLISRYLNDGISAVDDYLGHADALITSDELSHEVVDLYSSEHLDKVEKQEEISMKIMRRHLKLTKDGVSV
jgi:integrase